MRSALKNHSKKLRSKRRGSRLVFCLDFEVPSRRAEIAFFGSELNRL